MRIVLSAVIVSLLALPVTVRADDAPEGSIGIMIKLEDGKIVVVEPIKDSPADKAGIKPDDVLLKIDDYKIKDNAAQDDLTDAVKEIVKRKPGDKIKVTVKRSDKEMVIEVTVGKRSEIFPKD